MLIMTTTQQNHRHVKLREPEEPEDESEWPSARYPSQSIQRRAGRQEAEPLAAEQQQTAAHLAGGDYKQQSCVLHQCSGNVYRSGLSCHQNLAVRQRVGKSSKDPSELSVH